MCHISLGNDKNFRLPLRHIRAVPFRHLKMPSSKLKIAIAGLGRMGSRHASHFHHLTPKAELVAASSPEPVELTWAHQNLDGVRTYLDYDDMLEKEIPNGLQAVVIASATAVHAEQAIKAIQRGLHVLCEKPLSTGVEQVRLPNYATAHLNTRSGSLMQPDWKRG